jgi:group I intron endonuclease
MTCGIYSFKNLANGKQYIGSSINIENRIRQHLCALIHNKHHSILFQYAFNKYGWEYFEATIMEECTLEELHEREQFYLDTIRPFDSSIGYNISMDAIAPTRGRKINLSDESMQKKRDRMLGNTITLGYHHTDDTRQRMSNSRKGRSPSEETLRKSREAHIKTWAGLVSPDGIVYPEITNLAEFCKIHNLNSGNIQALYKGTREQCKGWTTVDKYYVKKERSDKGKKTGRKEKRAKVWEGYLISPDGEKYKDIVDLRWFCEEQNINYCCIQRLYRNPGKRIYRGWYVYIGDDPESSVAPPVFKRVQSQATRDKIRERLIGNANGDGNKGNTKKMSDETKKKISDALAGTIDKLVSPTGEIFTNIVNISQFCKEHGLIDSGVRRLITGEIKTHKGWRLDETTSYHAGKMGKRFRGVTFVEKSGKWISTLNLNKRKYHLGTFATEEDAARAYDKKARELGLDILNFPGELG